MFISSEDCNLFSYIHSFHGFHKLGKDKEFSVWTGNLRQGILCWGCCSCNDNVTTLLLCSMWSVLGERNWTKFTMFIHYFLFDQSQGGRLLMRIDFWSMKSLGGFVFFMALPTVSPPPSFPWSEVNPPSQGLVAD